MSNVFEGTEPLREAGSINSPPSPGPMSGIDPNDAGVDISGLFNFKTDALIFINIDS